MKTVLVTGGAGYIGSHCCKAFAESGWSVIAYDNLSRGWRDAIKWGPLVEGDIGDAAAVAAALHQYRPNVVAHFAAYAYVAESVERPELYYRNNSFGTLVLLEEMLKIGIDKLILSSTCASYGIPVCSPIDETHPQSPTLWMVEIHHRTHGRRSLVGPWPERGRAAVFQRCRM